MEPALRSDARIVVIGTSAAGKTSLARQLADRVRAPFVELDELYWGPNWTPKAHSEFERLLLESAQAPAWVVAGNYSAIRNTLWPRANTIIWLNYSLPVVFWRGARRTFLRYVRRERLWHGNRESLSRTLLSRDSILFWILSTHGRRQAEFQRLMRSAEFPHLTWLEFKSPRKLNQWLERSEYAA